MSTLMETFKEKYDEISVGIDPIIDGWLLMKTPGPLLTILAMYLMFVLKVGPSLMANRKAFNLQGALILYNAYQVLFSTWMCSKAFQADSSISSIFNNSCNNTAAADKKLVMIVWEGAWWYFFSKVIDLLDTVFFVLRKKQNQITFLHVYHHTITALFSWGYLKYLPGEQGVVIGLLNSFVHIIMYFYYMLAAMGPRYQKYLWWKKYMTWVQLIQFCLMLFYLISITVMDCKLPKGLTFFFVANCTIFLYLFGNFYRNAYNKRTAQKTSNNLLTESDDLKRRIAENDRNNNCNNMNNINTNGDISNKSIKAD